MLHYYAITNSHQLLQISNQGFVLRTKRQSDPLFLDVEMDGLSEFQ